MRNKQWQKHHKKDQTTANRMTVFFFYEVQVGTAVWSREFYRGKIPVAIPRFLPRKQKKTPSFDSPWFGLSLWRFCHCLFLIGNFVMVDSPRFPKSSGIDPEKALKKMASVKNYILYECMWVPGSRPNRRMDNVQRRSHHSPRSWTPVSYLTTVVTHIPGLYLLSAVVPWHVITAQRNAGLVRTRTHPPSPLLSSLTVVLVGSSVPIPYQNLACPPRHPLRKGIEPGVLPTCTAAIMDLSFSRHQSSGTHHGLSMNPHALSHHQDTAAAVRFILGNYHLSSFGKLRSWSCVLIVWSRVPTYCT